MVFDFFVRGLSGTGAAGAQELMVMGWLFSLTWAVGSLILGSEAILAPGGGSAGLGQYLLLTLGGFGLYAVVHQVILSGAGGPTGGAGTSSMLLALYYVTAVALMAAWAWLLSLRDPAGEALSHSGAVWGAPVAALAVAAVAFFTNFNEVRADIYYKEAWQGYHTQANAYLDKGDKATADAYFDSAIRSYDKAISLDPSEDYYLLFKGKALLERADGEAQALEDKIPAEEAAQPDFSEYADANLRALVETRDRAFDKALGVLQQALAMAPLNTDHYANLGRAYQVWGERTHAATERADRLQASLDWFDKAIEHSPNNAGLRTEQATSAFLAGDDQAALARIDQALALDSQYGRPYRLRATIRRQEEDWAAAEADYQKYVASSDGKGDAVGWSGLAYVLGQQGKTKEAIDANKKVLDLAGDDLATIRNLVLLYRDAKDPASACQYADKGLALAPDDAALLQLAGEIGCQSAASASQPAAADEPATP
jgi:tetratricopeptide (TPR) repeat protein